MIKDLQNHQVSEFQIISFVDKIIFGRTNYSKEVTAYKTHRDYYNQKAQEVIDFCESRGIQYYIKAKTVTEG